MVISMANFSPKTSGNFLNNFHPLRSRFHSLDKQEKTENFLKTCQASHVPPSCYRLMTSRNDRLSEQQTSMIPVGVLLSAASSWRGSICIAKRNYEHMLAAALALALQESLVLWPKNDWLACLTRSGVTACSDFNCPLLANGCSSSWPQGLEILALML